MQSIPKFHCATKFTGFFFIFLFSFIVCVSGYGRFFAFGQRPSWKHREKNKPISPLESPNWTLVFWFWSKQMKERKNNKKYCIKFEHPVKIYWFINKNNNNNKPNQWISIQKSMELSVSHDESLIYVNNNKKHFWWLKRSKQCNRH